MLTIASCITLLRIALTPVVVFTMVCESWLMATILFAVALFTDLLDGFIARRFHQQTAIGQILDPIADKILFGSVMFTFLVTTTMPWWITKVLWFLIIKEITMLSIGGILWFGFKKFIQPSRLSRLVSLCEVMLLVALFMLHVPGVVVPIYLMMLTVMINVCLSCWLLLLYGWKLMDMMDPRIKS